MSDELKGAAADLAAAPFDRARWDAALGGLAHAGGGWAAQLAVVSPTRGYVLNMTPRPPADLLAEFERFGLDPADQPRRRITLAPLMQVQGDNDFATQAEQAQSAVYAFRRRNDVPYACMARFDKSGEAAVLTSSLRSAPAGHIQAVGRERFSALLPHLRTAVRLQLRLEDHGARLAMGMMDSVGHAAVGATGPG